ncbi:MAG: metallophosphoesterase [Planctomycetota bacterium]
MIVGLMADSHDHMRLVRAALEVFRGRGAEVVLHAGDVVAPFAAKLLAGFEKPVHAVFGNNDGERAGLGRVLDIAAGPRALELGGRRIVVAHDLGDVPEGEMAGADVVVTGHTHAPLVGPGEPGEPGQPLRVNPGETGGWLTGRATCAVLDTESLETELCELGAP